MSSVIIPNFPESTSQIGMLQDQVEVISPNSPMPGRDRGGERGHYELTMKSLPRVDMMFDKA